MVYEVYEINTGDTVAIFDDKRSATSHAAELNDDYSGNGYEFSVRKASRWHD